MALQVRVRRFRPRAVEGEGVTAPHYDDWFTMTARAFGLAHGCRVQVDPTSGNHYCETGGWRYSWRDAGERRLGVYRLDSWPISVGMTRAKAMRQLPELKR